jgi:thiol:disulfide interchange protein DsbD
MGQWLWLWGLLLAVVAGFAWAEDDLLPPEQAFKFSARMLDDESIEVRYRIADGYYMYRDKFRFTAQPASVVLGVAQFPTGKIKEDEFFGKVETYRGELVLRVPVTASPGANEFKLQAVSQGCADAGVCYTPLKQTAQLVLAAANNSAGASAVDGSGGVMAKLRALTNSNAADDFLPVEQAFKVSVRAQDAKTLVADFEPAQSYYLYRDKIKFSLPKNPGVTIAEVVLPRGELKSDPNFGDTEVFHRAFQARIRLDRADPGARQVALEAGYQGCAEKGLCYPPTKKTFELTLASLSSDSRVATRKPAEPSTSAVVTTPDAARAQTPPAAAPAPEQNDSSKIAAIFRTGNFIVIVASFFGFGVLLSFTPCVLPMVPILSGIIVGQGHKVTRGHAFSLSLFYVLGMAITYAAAGVAAGLSGTLLSNALQNPWVLGGFACVFIVLALSMFGFYELQLPTALQSKLSDVSNRAKGGTGWSVFVMGVLSALIVGPCVAAPLAGALLYIGKSRDVLLGGSALFAMALGMGVPLMAVGLSAGSLLPKVGAWMQTVKNLFGVLLLGLAIWIVSPVIPAAVHLLLWAALLIISAIYLHAIDPLPNNASGFRKLWKGVGLIALLLGVALLIGALSGGRDVLQPLSGFRGAGAASQLEAAGVQFQRVRSLSELNQRIAQAGGRPVMLDFYADWCVSCKEMERFTFSDPKVRERLAKMVLLQADVTASTGEDEELLKRFGLYGPPGILFFGVGGEEIEAVRVIGFQPAERFVGSLDTVLSAS